MWKTKRKSAVLHIDVIKMNENEQERVIFIKIIHLLVSAGSYLLKYSHVHLCSDSLLPLL